MMVLFVEPIRRVYRIGYFGIKFIIQSLWSAMVELGMKIYGMSEYAIENCRLYIWNIENCSAQMNIMMMLDEE